LGDSGIHIEAAINAANVRVNFNNIEGNANHGVFNGGTGILDATMNWWGDISGPKHDAPFGIFPANPGGTGDRVSDNVNYIPWLTRDFQTVLDDNIAYFGIPMVYLNTGWNTFSTPIALDPACDTWEEYIGLGDGLEIYPGATTYYFDGENQVYGQVLGNYRLDPCDAIYVRMLEPDIAAILFSPNVSVSAKQLHTGWNLVGLAWMPMAEGEPWGMKTNDALKSVETVAGDLTGYVQVVSPPMNQQPWTYIAGSEIGAWTDPPPSGWMMPTKGYWVFMINDGTLAGFTFTPQSLP